MNVAKLREVFGEWPLRVGEFFKVGYEQFHKDWLDTFPDAYDEEKIKDAHYFLKCPIRATTGSGGYDFYSPLTFILEPNEEIKIPTGIRVQIEPGWVLKLYPKSGLGFKYYSRMANTIPVVDGDYYYSDNEGHIFVKLRNEGTKTMTIQEGDKFCQGIFEIYGIVKYDNAQGVRNGGFGSTGK